MGTPEVTHPYPVSSPRPPEPLHHHLSCAGPLYSPAPWGLSSKGGGCCCHCCGLERGWNGGWNGETRPEGPGGMLRDSTLGIRKDLYAPPPLILLNLIPKLGIATGSQRRTWALRVTGEQPRLAFHGKHRNGGRRLP